MNAVASVAGHVREQLRKAVVGQEEVIDQSILAILCGGHALMEGVPGTAKTLIVKVISRVLQVGFHRVQCTSDLMPADIIGTNIFNAASASFHLHKGPVFTDLLLVDEINRMPPRTQAALLEAMEERQVTIDGVRHPLSSYFTVFATQNPIEFEGTYPLPEAQLDRFLLKIEVPYPQEEAEIEILRAHQNGFNPRHLDEISFSPIDSALLDECRHAVASITVEPSLLHYVSKLTRRTREWPSIALGASPRAAVNLLQAAKGFAALEERDYLIPDDVKAAAAPVLGHRILLKPDAELEGLSSRQVLQQVVKSVEVPK